MTVVERRNTIEKPRDDRNQCSLVKVPVHELYPVPRNQPQNEKEQKYVADELAKRRAGGLRQIEWQFRNSVHSKWQVLFPPLMKRRHVDVILFRHERREPLYPDWRAPVERE